MVVSEWVSARRANMAPSGNKGNPMKGERVKAKGGENEVSIAGLTKGKD